VSFSRFKISDFLLVLYSYAILKLVTYIKKKKGLSRNLAQSCTTNQTGMQMPANDVLDFRFESAVDYWIVIRSDFQNLSNLPGMHLRDSRLTRVLLVASLSFLVKPELMRYFSVLIFCLQTQAFNLICECYGSEVHIPLNITNLLLV